MLAAFASAVSGMRAATLRLQASASNVANADARGAWPSGGAASADLPQAYQPIRVEQTSMAGADGAGGGTIAMVRYAAPAWRAGHDPDASFADAEGMVAEPNVDLVGEALEQATAEASFLANVKVLQSAQEMVKRLFELAD